MAFNQNTITAPVSIYDVQQALGSSSPDLATLCKSASIKMWARFRPVEYKSAGRTGSAWVRQVPDSGTPSRESVAFGIVNIPVWNDRLIGQMLNFWSEYDQSSPNPPSYIDENGDTVSTPLLLSEYWKMKLPTSAFRLTDFVSTANPTTKGYFTGAKAPISGLTVNAVAVTPKGLVTILYTKNEEGVSAGLTIKYEDLQFANNYTFSYNYYFGVALVKLVNGEPTNTAYYITQATQMSSFQAMGAFVRGYITSESFAGTYLAFPFISADALIGSASPAASDYYEFLTSYNTRGVYTALIQPQELTVTINYCELDVNSLNAWKDTSQSTRLIYYSYNLSNASSDTTVQDTFTITQTLYDSNDNVINQTTREVSLYGQGTSQIDGSIDAGAYFSGAHHLTVQTTPKANTNVVFYNAQSETTTVMPTPPITPNNINNNESI